MHGVRTTTAVAAAGFFALTGASSAVAAASTGADVYKQTECVDYGPVEVCGTLHSTINIVHTPHGLEMMRGESRYDTTVLWDEGFTYSTTGSSHYHSLSKDRKEVLLINRRSEIYSSPETGTCTVVVDIHFVNGRFQSQQESFDCVPS